MNCIILTKEESQNFLEKLKKADESNALINILQKCTPYVNIFEFYEVFKQLKEGSLCKISERTLYLINREYENWEKTLDSKSKNVTVTIKGFEKIEEANEFCEWYSGQGEQDSSVWFDCRASEGIIETTTMNTESIIKIDENNIEMNLKMYK